MIIKPMVRNNVCLNSHPEGCAAAVMRQIKYVSENRRYNSAAPKLALIIGCSTGYGLASRITAAFGYGAITVGVSVERPASQIKTGTPGFYNNIAFDREAASAGLVSKTINGDAFSNETKAATIEAIRKAAMESGIPPKVDLVIYSLASPVRTDPKTGITYKSVIKPIGQTYTGKTIDMMSASIVTVNTEPASDEETENTIRVMGGDDWKLWIDALTCEDVLSPNAKTAAYTYIGPELSWPIYKNGTIGRAKDDLEKACREINAKYPAAGKMAGAWVSVNKALVTRASAVIPIIPFYVSCLYKVMKEKGVHEGCIEQMVRMFRDRLYRSEGHDPAMVPVDSGGRIRMDDLEMREDIQKAVNEKMKIVTADNVLTETDIAGFRHDFLEAHGFDIEGIDYDKDIPLQETGA